MDIQKTIKNMQSKIKKYWYILVILVFIVLPFFLRIYRDSKSKVKNPNGNTSDIFDTLNVPTSQREYLKQKTVSIAHNLGTAYVWADPRRWSENDKKVYEDLKDVSLADFKIIEVLYYNVNAKGRVLSIDLKKMLNDKYYQLLTVK